MLRLQRTLGNTAVTRLLRPQPATPPRRRQVLQRNKESQELMTKVLAKPQTFQLEGKEIEIQDDLAGALDEAILGDLITAPKEIEALDKQWYEENALEKTKERTAGMQALLDQMQQKRANLGSYNDATFIGAIVLHGGVGKLEGLISSATLVDLPSLNDKTAKVKQSLAGGAYHLVQKKGLASSVIKNTLVTMEKAGQLEYLRQAGLPNDKYAILIEVHYYRNRPTSKTKLHKDTLGETLFVNLSFTNKNKILGPEYIVNPASDPSYDEYVKQKLPGVFVEDLEAFKTSFKDEKIIKATVLKPNSVVAFVDEAIHHKTPTPGPRTASATGLDVALDNVYGDEYRDANAAYKGYKGASKVSLWTFASYFKNPTAKAHSGDWWQLLEKLATLTKELKRDELKAWLPAYFQGHAEELLEQAATDFTGVSLAIGGNKRITVPVRQKQEKPLKRQMSMEDLSEYKATAEESGKRSFFRTWVRAVPKERFG